MDIRNFFQKNASASKAEPRKNGSSSTVPVTTNSSQTAPSSPQSNKRIKREERVFAKDPPSSKKEKEPKKSQLEISDREEEEDDSSHEEEFQFDQDLTETHNKKPPGKGATKKKESRKKEPRGPPVRPNKSITSYTADQATPGVLNGLNFVFTGVLSSVGREEAEDYVKTLGGKVTAAVSGKTHYLICGTILEDGRPVVEGSKYRKAQELGGDKVAILQNGEGELYALVQLLDQTLKAAASTIPTCHGDNSKQVPPTTTMSTSVSGTTTTTTTTTTTQSSNPYAKKKTAPVNPYANKTSLTTPAIISSNNNTSTVSAAKTGSSNPYAKKNNITGTKSILEQPTSRTTKNKGDETHNLWTDTYAPVSSDQILGNKECVHKLNTCTLNYCVSFHTPICFLFLFFLIYNIYFMHLINPFLFSPGTYIGLTRWEDTFIHASKGGKKVSVGNPQGPFKAALLSGPPGIGKTTTAHIVAKEAGRQVLEWNASDTRSKKSLAENLGDVTGSQVLSFDHHQQSHSKNNTAILRCIIMDEVDGMGAGDRSGMAELIKMIKNSKVPIICICNDRQSPKIKSLAVYCLDLRFRRPVKSVIAKRVLEIGNFEGLRVETNAAEAIAESCGNDIRQVINCLQMWASKKGMDNMTYKDVKERENLICKDEILRVSIFDATKLIVEGRRGINTGPNKAKAAVDSLYMRNDAFFTEYSLMGLNVHSNYLQVLIAPFQDTKRRGNSNAELQCLDRMFQSTSTMSDYAVVDHAVMSGDQQWALLPLCAILAIKTGYHAGGEQGMVTFT